MGENDIYKYIEYDKREYWEKIKKQMFVPR